VALKIADGIDHYNSATDFLARRGFLQWQFPNAVTPSTFSFPTGLTGIGKALRVGGIVNGGGSTQPYIRAVWGDRNAEAFYGFRFQCPAGNGFVHALFDGVAGDTQLTLWFNPANYSISVYRGTKTSGTLLGVSPNNSWRDSSNFCEVHYKIHASAGVVEIRIDCESVYSLSSANTKQTANSWVDAVDWFAQNVGQVANVDLYLDDIYYCDTTSDPGATANNTFMGDVGTRTLFATGDGSVDFVPNSGGNNYSRINETAMDSDTSYNSSATPGDEDQFAFQPITNVIAAIYGVQVTIAARKDDVGPRVIKTGLVSGGTTDYGANHSLPDVVAYFTDMWILDPDTTANWTRVGVNAALGIYNLVS
jgi:hypothetical protein